MPTLKSKLSEAAIEMYTHIKWPELWREFVSELNTWGNIKYLSVDHLCRAKFIDKTKRETLLTIIGSGVSADLQKWARKHTFQWVGNWDERRERFWTSAELLRQLIAESSRESCRRLLERLRNATAMQIAHAETISAAADLAYCGQPFLPDLAPTAPRNIYRFRKYVSAYEESFCLLHQAAMALSRAALIEAALDGQLTHFAATSLSPQADTLLFAGQLAALNKYNQEG